MQAFKKLSKKNCEALLKACNTDDVELAKHVLSKKQKLRHKISGIFNYSQQIEENTFNACVNIAIKAKSIQVLPLLLDDPRIIHRAASMGPIMTALEEGRNSDVLLNQDINRKIETVILMLFENPIIKKQKVDTTLLTWAAGNHQVEMVKELLMRDDVNPIGTNNYPLKQAITSGSVEITSLLLSNPQVKFYCDNINDTYSFSSAIMVAVWSDHPTAAQMIWHLKDNPNYSDNDFKNHFYYACGEGAVQFMTSALMLAKERKMDIFKNNNSMYLLRASLATKDFEVIQMLLNYPDMNDAVIARALLMQTAIDKMSFIVLMCDSRFDIRNTNFRKIYTANELVRKYGLSKLTLCLSYYLKAVGCLDVQLKKIEYDEYETINIKKLQKDIMNETDAIMKIIRENIYHVSPPVIFKQIYKVNNSVRDSKSVNYARLHIGF